MDQEIQGASFVIFPKGGCWGPAVISQIVLACSRKPCLKNIMIVANSFGTNVNNTLWPATTEGLELWNRMGSHSGQMVMEVDAYRLRGAPSMVDCVRVRARPRTTLLMLVEMMKICQNQKHRLLATTGFNVNHGELFITQKRHEIAIEYSLWNLKNPR
jgi:hypothetical protein